MKYSTFPFFHHSFSALADCLTEVRSTNPIPATEIGVNSDRLTLVPDLHTTNQHESLSPLLGEVMALRADGIAGKKSKKEGSQSKLKKAPPKPVTNLSVTKRGWIEA